MLLMVAALLMGEQIPPASEAPVSDGNVVVTGRRELNVRGARRHVNAIIQTREGQVRRFHAPVCPLVIGMGRREAEVVVARIREVAAQAHIETAGADCQPNVALIVAPNGRQLIDALRRRRPEVFRSIEADEMRHLLNARAHVRAWTTTELINEDGLTVNPETRVLQVRSASILTLPTMQAMRQSVVVIDDDVADGKSLGQLADYVAMRAFAGVHPPADAANRGTILTLFDPGRLAPVALTALDAAFLSALYRSGANQNSMWQMNQIARMIAHDVAAVPADGE